MLFAKGSASELPGTLSRVLADGGRADGWAKRQHAIESWRAGFVDADAVFRVSIARHYRPIIGATMVRLIPYGLRSPETANSRVVRCGNSLLRPDLFRQPVNCGW